MNNYKTMKFIRDDTKFKKYIKHIKNPYVTYAMTLLYLDDDYLLYNTRTHMIVFSNANIFFPKEMLYEIKKTYILDTCNIYIKEKYYEDDRCSVCDRYLTCPSFGEKCKQKNIIYKRITCSSDIVVDIRGMEKIDKFLKEE